MSFVTESPQKLAPFPTSSVLEGGVGDELAQYLGSCVCKVVLWYVKKKTNIAETETQDHLIGRPGVSRFVGPGTS